MNKIMIKDFAKWLGFSEEAVRLAIQIVQMSDPDGAYTHLQDMGQDEAAEVVEAIWFEHGSLKDAISAFKEDEEFFKDDSPSDELNEIRREVRSVLREIHEEREEIDIFRRVPKEYLEKGILPAGNYSSEVKSDDVSIHWFQGDDEDGDFVSWFPELNLNKYRNMGFGVIIKKDEGEVMISKYTNPKGNHKTDLEPKQGRAFGNS